MCPQSENEYRIEAERVRGAASPIHQHAFAPVAGRQASEAWRLMTGRPTASVATPLMAGAEWSDQRPLSDGGPGR
jgi:hypothetical protein